MKRPAFPFFAFALTLLVLCGTARTTYAETTKIKIGALLSLTGEWSSLGIASKAAMQFAVGEINQELISNGSSTRVELLIEDTELDPDLALKKFKALADQGVTIIVGPQSSAEVRAIEPLALKQKILVISQGSTASSLAIADDAVFRFCPTDVHEGAASAALMKNDGIKAMIPVWRGDAGNDGLESSTSKAFVELGGTSLAGIRYSTTTTNFTSIVSDLTSKVRSATAKYGAGKVAVYLASFDEGIRILALARGNEVLSAVHWHGGDGLTQSQALLDNADASAFARNVKFTTPTLGLDPAAADIQQNLSNAVYTRVGYEPDAFAMAAYDATYVGYIARYAVADARNIGALQSAFARSANRYWGATGATTLDASGDRAQGNYDFYTVTRSGWTYASSYVNGEIITE